MTPGGRLRQTARPWRGLQTIGIIGAGAWGTALAQAAARAGRAVVLWARDPEVVRALRERRVNPRHLADIALEPAIDASDDLAAVAAADLAAADGAGAGPARARPASSRPARRRW